MRFIWLGCCWSLFQNLSTCPVFLDDDAECCRKVASRRKAEGRWLMLVGLQLECARVLYETLLIHAPMNYSDMEGEVLH